MTLPRHWVRNTGRLVLITLTNGTQVTGRVAGIDGDVITLTIENKGRTSSRDVRLADITKALVQIEFARVESAQLEPLADDSGEEAEDDSADNRDDDEEI